MVARPGGDAVTVVHGFNRTVSIASVAIGLSLSTVGCVGGDAPDDPSGNAGKGGSSPNAGAGGHSGSGSAALKAGAKESHFPLVAGATWTYRHVYPQNPGKQPWDEIATMSAATFEGAPAFILEDEEDAQGERSSSTMLIEGTRVQRVYKEVKVGGQLAFKTTYDPGFLRYDEAWKEGSSDQLAYDSLQLCIMQSSASKCAPGAMRMETTTHTYKVLSEHAQITVAAGTFDTVQIERNNLGDPNVQGDDEAKHFWYAAGVGKVRELDVKNGATEELSSYNIP
jgi:hypothetical protein